MTVTLTNPGFPTSRQVVFRGLKPAAANADWDEKDGEVADGDDAEKTEEEPEAEPAEVVPIPAEEEDDPFDDFDDEDFDDEFDDDFEEELEDDYEIEPDDSDMFPDQAADDDLMAGS